MSDENRLHFLIDYENVREAGLDGVEHLQDTDILTIFFSTACKNISRRMMDYIWQSGCEFHACKLKNTGKNALDFYIATCVGELLGAGFPGKIIIVSRDKGYGAVRDYWMGQGISSDRILRSPSVKAGIISSNENSLRQKRIAVESAQISIENEYVRYQERQRMKYRLEAIFHGTEYEEKLVKICELAEMKRKPKDLYIGSLKRFGRTDGTKIYRYLKQADVSA
ncbi:MAG: PIN domain-containing protein [Clostridiales bacterium]|nr:PIN domain-containing protein [Clostridiales bacterium]